MSHAPDAVAPDDATLLVLADELQLKGDLRGELIVTQCELARGGFSRERGISLRKRELELLLAHEDEWANLQGLARNWTFRRGFVDEITIDVAKFTEHEDEIWRRAPYLRWVRFTGLEYDSPIDDLGDPALEWPKVQPRLERALTRVRYFGVEDARVRWMHDGTMSRYMTSGPLDDAIARWVTSDASLLARLRGISLSAVGPHALNHLALSAAASGIEELELQGDLFENPHRLKHHFIATKLAPRRLRILGGQGAWDEDRAAIRMLLETPLGSRVTDLDTFHLDPVLASGRAPQLRALRVSPLQDEKIFVALANASELSSLEHLRLDVFPGRQVDLPIEPLHNPKHLNVLRTLLLGPGVSLESAKALVQSPLAKRLELIDLRHSKTQLAPHVEELRSLWDGMILV